MRPCTVPAPSPDDLHRVETIQHVCLVFFGGPLKERAEIREDPLLKDNLSLLMETIF